MLFIVEDENFRTTDPEELKDFCIDDDYYDDDEDGLREWINERYPQVEIGPHCYDPYDVLDTFNDLYDFRDEYIDQMLENDRDNFNAEIHWALNGNQRGRFDIQRYTIYFEPEEEEEEPEVELPAGTDWVEDMFSGTDWMEDVKNSLAEQEVMKQQDKESETNYLDLFQKIG